MVGILLVCSVVLKRWVFFKKIKREDRVRLKKTKLMLHHDLSPACIKGTYGYIIHKRLLKRTNTTDGNWMDTIPSFVITTQWRCTVSFEASKIELHPLLILSVVKTSSEAWVVEKLDSKKLYTSEHLIKGHTRCLLEAVWVICGGASR